MISRISLGNKSTSKIKLLIMTPSFGFKDHTQLIIILSVIITCKSNNINELIRI